MGEGRVVWVPTDEQLELARDWAGGISTMLRAVESTGRLVLGTRRPIAQFDRHGFPCGWKSAVDERPMTDEEWALSLLADLSAELGNVARLAEGEFPNDVAIALQWWDEIDMVRDRAESDPQVVWEQPREWGIDQ